MQPSPVLIIGVDPLRIEVCVVNALHKRPHIVRRNGMLKALHHDQIGGFSGWQGVHPATREGEQWLRVRRTHANLDWSAVLLFALLATHGQIKSARCLLATRLFRRRTAAAGRCRAAHVCGTSLWPRVALRTAAAKESHWSRDRT